MMFKKSRIESALPIIAINSSLINSEELPDKLFLEDLVSFPHSSFSLQILGF